MLPCTHAAANALSLPGTLSLSLNTTAPVQMLLLWPT